MLYIYTVYCTIYQMREDGKKLAPEEIRATGRVARLKYGRHPAGQPVQIATMYDVVSGIKQGQLESATLKAIDGGIKIAGHESFGVKAQVWWCVPLTPEQNAELKATLERIRPMGTV